MNGMKGFCLDIDDLARLLGCVLCYQGEGLYSLYVPSHDCEVVGDYWQIQDFLEKLQADEV